MERRTFLRLAGAGAASMAAGTAWAQADGGNERPNILWITCEDTSPNLKCFGDDFAITPNLDAFAADGIRYRCAFSHAPVCAPARSGIITSIYPQSLGSQHMRSKAPKPAYIRCFTEYLREAGYYCSNRHKEDYNFEKTEGAWDDSSRNAHWRNRAPGQPFFSVVNLTVTHEGQIRLPDDQFARRTAELDETERHDPASVPVPPFHPDTPEVRKDWAHYYDLVTVMDKQVGRILRELEQDGVADNTIVFFYGDHGVGLPRGKRWLYDTGLQVPLIVRFPRKYQKLAPDAPGAATDRLVAFVDFGATVLSLAGVEVPAHMQGRPFLGGQAKEPRKYVYAGRDRMDERYDRSRAVRDGRFKYIRNLMPHLCRAQFLEYMYQMPTMKVWADLKRQGKLDGPAALFMEDTKPGEELYDMKNDPFEINNLAADAAHAETLNRMRVALADWMRDIGDLGLLPESEMHKRAAGRPFYELRNDREAFPVDDLLAASGVTPPRKDAADGLEAPDPAARFWAVMRLYQAPQDAEPPWLDALEKRLDDESGAVCVAAAGLLHRHRPDRALPALVRELESPEEWVRLQAANELDRLGKAAKPALEIFKKLQDDPNNYVVRVANHAVETLTTS